MVRDTIVVISNVKPARYQKQRSSLLRAGIKPVVVSVSNDFFPVRFSPVVEANIADYMAVLHKHYYGLEYEPAPNTVFNLVACDIIDSNPDLDLSRISLVVYSKTNHRAWKDVEYCKVFFGRTSCEGKVHSV